MLIEDAFKDLEDRFWEKNSSEGIIGNSEVQSNPAISNSVNSKSLLFRSNRSFPYTVYTLIFNPVILKKKEETPKRPTKSEVRQAIETLSRYNLFAVEGAEIQGQTSQLSFNKSIIEKTNSDRALKDFSMQQHLLKLSDI